MHRQNRNHIIYLLCFCEEAGIETIYTGSKRFTRCSNSKCKTLYPVEDMTALGEFELLCPLCKAKVQSHHIVQCLNCQSIVNFIQSEVGEEPIVFHVEKCSLCTGTREDEKRLQAYYYPEAFM